MRKLIVIFCLLCCGCFDYNEASNTLIVSSIGFDYDESYKFYYYLINPETLTTSELGSSSAKDKYMIAEVSANSFHEAWNKLLIYSNENISAAHLQSIILSKAFYEQKLDELLKLFKSAPWYYPDFKIFVTLHNLEEIFRSENPENVSPYFSIIGEFSNDKIYNYTTYTQFAVMQSEKNLNSRFPVISLRDDIWESSNEKLISIAYSGLIFFNENSNIIITRDQFQVIDLIAKKNDITLIYDGVAFKLDNIKIRKSYSDGIILKITGNCEVVNNVSYNIDQYKNILVNNVSNELKALIDYGILHNQDIFSINDYLYRIKKANVDYSNIDYYYDINLTFDF